MSLTTIYVTRHGFRSTWSVDHKNGIYSSSIKSPTGIPNDPALTSYGVQQSIELGEHLKTVDPPIERIYSSPYYRCLQTIDPFAEQLSTTTEDPTTALIRPEPGLGEFFGLADFLHPVPASPEILKRHFKRLAPWTPLIKPNEKGESIEQLHERVAYAMAKIIEYSEKEDVKAVVICTHAAAVIAIGRVLTGVMPEDITESDFHPFTCSLSTFVRRKKEVMGSAVPKLRSDGGIPNLGWRNGNGIGGGWDVVGNGDCSFLSGGAERGWSFNGDESFIPEEDPDMMDDPPIKSNL
ncbi:phosphoglycerate mutase-like protein [Mollisia scopiformis]|uniref:Phosphoglycerate mutase-like protein n=1 Tax=Mollisia scopiformis TaxID=149040 RepID=A0A194XMS4_MOLSC|nr:phosphoglycerate mutase-like protein [Mollisia scopiformis]KUJ21077.1 phosphoglycerate mutase-like protein [Mollisia scopiformis]